VAQVDRSADSIKLDTTQEPRWEWMTVTNVLERPNLEPERVAMVYENRQRTYGELRDRSRRVGNALIELGVQEMDRVAIASTNCLEFIEIESGIAAARAIMVGLNWRLSKPEFANLMRRSDAKVLFVEARFLDVFLDLRADGELPSLQTIVVLGEGETTGTADREYEELCASASPAPPVREGRLSDPHEIIYTSGTTGEPKGVVWTNGMLLFNAIQYISEFRLGPESSHYTLVDQYYIGGRHAFVWPLLLQGGVAHVKPSSSFDGTAIVAYWAAHGITHQMLAPTMLYDILKVSTLCQTDLSTMRTIVLAGGPVDRPALERAQQLMPHTEVAQVFGMTEAAGCVTCLPGHFAKAKLGSTGRPGWTTRLRIVDDAGHDLPPNENGEILVQSATVTAGYWDAPEMTREAIVDGWLHTGDTGYLDEEGFLYIQGRKKDMIISGGMNIYPSEIEEVLREHPSVADVAVIGVPHERWGETVCAVIEAAPGATVDEAEIVAFSKEHLASYKKPSLVRVIDAIPRTAAGKPQKFLLRERFANAAQEPVSP
jgi:acyl-CoA synthetase (AMP-forming)/AMP-acid ligase II